MEFKDKGGANLFFKRLSELVTEDIDIYPFFLFWFGQVESRIMVEIKVQIELEVEWQV